MPLNNPFGPCVSSTCFRGQGAGNAVDVQSAQPSPRMLHDSYLASAIHCPIVLARLCLQLDFDCVGSRMIG